MKKFLSFLSSPLCRFAMGGGLMRKLLNLFPLILPLCLIALIGGSSASAAVPTPSPLAQQPPPCVLFGDFSEDGQIDVADIMQVANKWRSKCGDGDYDSRYDIDNDCDIDIVDIMTVASRWGCECGDDCYGIGGAAISQGGQEPPAGVAAERTDTGGRAQPVPLEDGSVMVAGPHQVQEMGRMGLFN